MAHEVSDGPRVLGNHDECGMAGETPPELWQHASQTGTHQQCGRIDCPGTDHNHFGINLIISRLPGGWLALPAGWSRMDPRKYRLLADSEYFTARDDLHPVTLGLRQLHTVGTLFRLIRTAKVAEAGPPAAFEIHGKLLRTIAQLLTPFHKKPIVLVDPFVFKKVDVILSHEFSRPLFQ